MADYIELANGMSTEWKTAKELNIAAATLKAMANRSLIEVKVGKPNKYRRNESASKLMVIMNTLDSYVGREFAYLEFDNDRLGMLMQRTSKGWVQYDGTLLPLERANHVISICYYEHGEKQEEYRFRRSN